MRTFLHTESEVAPTAASEGIQTEEFDYLFERASGYKVPGRDLSIPATKCGFIRGCRPSKC